MNQRRLKSGFTLIELLVVIAIIGVLAGIIINSVNSARTKAQIAQAQQTVRSIRNAIALLEIDTGQWPGHKALDTIESSGSNEIWDLTTSASGLMSTDGSFPGWGGPYIRNIPLDPWGHPYFFDTDYDVDPSAGVTQAVVIGSFGPNGVGQNVYDSDNIFIKLIEE
jgi:general secretion pathway protein G